MRITNKLILSMLVLLPLGCCAGCGLSSYCPEPYAYDVVCVVQPPPPPVVVVYEQTYQYEQPPPVQARPAPLTRPHQEAVSTRSAPIRASRSQENEQRFKDQSHRQSRRVR